MFSHETFHVQMCAVMESLVEAAVAEMRRLLEQCSTMSMRNTCCLSLDTQEKDTVGTLQETGTQQLKAMTSQFASLMETWTKGAVEKLSLLLKISMSKDVSRPAPKKRGGVKYKTSRKTVKQRAGATDGDKKQSLLKGSCQKGKKTELELEIKRTKKEGNQGEGPDDTQKDDSQSRHIVFVIPMWPELGEKQEKVAAASQPPTEKEELQATQVVEETQEEVDTDLQPSNKEQELQATQPVSELNGEDFADLDVADLGTDLTCTNQELTADADKSKKKAELIKCPCCEKIFALKCFFDRHFLSHSKPHLCSQCGKRFARPEGLVAHSRKHTGEKLFKCTECGTGFAYKSTFNRHMHQHKCKKTQLCTQTCTFCDAEFTGKLAFQRHKCSALEKTFRCSLCARTFECRQSLADHENLHSGERDYVCEMCGERFFSSSSLSTHRVTHLQQDHCCDELGLGCSDSSVLQSHLSKHTGEKLFTCDVCGKGCSHQSALNHHMLTHTGERPYVCETCGKRCAHASALQNHMRVHTGQKPGRRPVCDVCGKTLSSMTKLKFHMSVHTGDKPYSCDQCGRRFRNPSNLNKHRMTHTGEKLYGCNICGRRFTAASSLRGHRLLHTGERPYQCPICGQNFKYHQRGEFKKHQKTHILPQSDK